MSTKTNTIYICNKCDAQYAKWTGRCLECGAWGTVKEENKTIAKKQSNEITYKASIPKNIQDITPNKNPRTVTNTAELDRVLGGGVVPGSLILLGGEPGIGKSTLSIQIATLVSPTLYISGEESIEQIKMRIDRLKLPTKDLQLLNETNVETICATIKKFKPKLAIIDSIQTVYSDEVIGENGNINQIKASTSKLLETAKSSNTAIIIIGHVTKDGTLAGPRTLEHLVDTVLYLEGDRYHSYRILRTIKNRFGATDEVGIFEMTELGLEQVADPSKVFLQEREEDTAGSVITCTIEGTRPILVEVQALVNKTVFGYPVRKASGFDLNRLHVLTAVLQKRAGINLAQYDIHLNIVGGIKSKEPALDLAVCLAIASAYKDKKLGSDLVAFGEVGLGGEIRSVNNLEKRIKECANLGIKKIITRLGKKEIKAKDTKIVQVKNIAELIKHT